MGSALLGGLVNSPQFAQFRQTIRNDPSALQPILEQLATTSPELYNVTSSLTQLIAQHPDEFERLIVEGGDDIEGLEGEESDNPPGSIVVSQEDEAAINRLAALGFPKIEAAQSFMACEKNE